MTQPFDPGDLSSVIETMYAMVSGPAGPRDWSLQKAIFHPSARQMRTGVDAVGRAWIRIMSPDEYVVDTGEFFSSNDFFEVEVARRIQMFGNIAHVWSVYEARNTLEDSVPERRGINSIQLFRNDAGHWQITSMIWDNERPGVAVDWAL